MWDKSNCSVICTLFKVTVNSLQYCLSCFEQFCWDLIRTCVFATCCLTGGTSNHWTKWWRFLLPIFLFNSFPFFAMIQIFTISLPAVCDLCSFSQIVTNRRTLTGYIADVAGTFESFIWLSGRAAWNLSLLLPILRMPPSCCCLSTLSFLCTSAFSSWYRFLSLPFASLFSLIAAKVSARYPILFLLRLDGYNRFSRHFQQDCLGTFPEIFWGYFILCSLQYRKHVGHLCCKPYCFLFLEFLEIQRRNAAVGRCPSIGPAYNRLGCCLANLCSKLAHNGHETGDGKREEDSSEPVERLDPPVEII